MATLFREEASETPFRNASARKFGPNSFSLLPGRSVRLCQNALNARGWVFSRSFPSSKLDYKSGRGSTAAEALGPRNLETDAEGFGYLKT